MQHIKQVFKSQKFLYFIFGVFVVQAVIYSVVIGFGVPSDEQYHFSSSQYYAHQSVTTGPFTNNQSPETIREVQSIDTNVTYLYHYTLRFPIRIFEAIWMDKNTQVLLLRLVNILFVVVSLVVIKRILDEISKDKFVKNAALAAFMLTGATVWLAASINYDNLAILLWSDLLLVWVRLIKQPSLNKALSVLALALITPLVKFTFLPFVFIVVFCAFAISGYKNRGKLANLNKNNIFSNFKVLNTLILTILVIISAGLLVERVGSNLIDYGRVQPKCDQIFTPLECRANNVYNRNFLQNEKFSQDEQNALVKAWDPFTHTGEWIYKMYNSLPWYLGHLRIESNNYSEVAAWLLTALTAVTILFSRKKMKFGLPAVFVLFATITYVLGVFLFNLNTYLSIGKMYAYQGRYLIPVLAFIYFFVILLVVNTLRNMKGNTKNVFCWLWLIILALYIISHFTPFVFLVGMDEYWFREYIIEITP